MQYIIQAQINIEIEAENTEKAKEGVSKKFQEIEKLGAKVENAKVVDKNSGYFLN